MDHTYMVNNLRTSSSKGLDHIGWTNTGTGHSKTIWKLQGNKKNILVGMDQWRTKILVWKEVDENYNEQERMEIVLREAYVQHWMNLQAGEDDRGVEK